MRSFLVSSILLIVALVSTNLNAQVYNISENSEANAEASVLTERFDATLFLMQKEEHKLALEAFHEAKKKGTLPKDRTQVFASQPLGSVVAFNVYNNLLDNNPSWGTEEFELKAEGTSFKLWVEVSELNSNAVTDAEIDVLADQLGSSSPAGSVDPNKGVIDNDNDVFGDPPNYDGDGKVDVLVYDIVDGGNNSGITILGFVISTDINPNAPAGSGNQRDVLYLDVQGFSRSGEDAMGSTSSHEYQHLIHYNYDLGETQFVNEGLSEWAQTVNGYPARRAAYLENGNSPTFNVPMFRWSSGADVLVDYARASLFTTYFAQKAGMQTTGSVTRNRGTGSIGMKDSLPFGSPFDFKDIAEGFHIANIVNDQSAGPDYGYEVEQRMQQVSVSLPPAKVVQGGQSSALSERTVTLQPGGVEYVQFNSVADLNINLDTASNSELIRDQIRPSVALYSGDGTVEIRRFRPGVDTFSVSGSFDKIILICSHTNPDDTSMTITYSANWTSSERRFANVSYESGTAEEGKWFAIGVGVSDRIDGEISNEFQVPNRYALSRVIVSPLFISQFNNSPLPETAPRDFKIFVRDDNAGKPGTELFSIDMTDTRPFSPVTSRTLDFIDVPMEAYVDNIGYPLPVKIYIGMGESGNDENWLVTGTAERIGDNVSYLSNENAATGWSNLQDITLTGGNGEIAYTNSVFPIRASFVFDRAIVSNEDLETPTQISLGQNYPNPFNPTTSITFKTVEPGPAKLAVYDITGRLIDVLYDEFLVAGEHNIGVDASYWASGLYLYELSAGGRTVTKKMTLLR